MEKYGKRCGKDMWKNMRKKMWNNLERYVEKYGKMIDVEICGKYGNTCEKMWKRSVCVCVNQEKMVTTIYIILYIYIYISLCNLSRI